MADITNPTRYTRNSGNAGPTGGHLKGGPVPNVTMKVGEGSSVGSAPSNPQDVDPRGGDAVPVNLIGGGPAIESTLAADRQAAVEQGLTLFQMTAGERDRLKSQVSDLNNIIAQQRVEIDALQSLVNMMESRIREYQIERDQAVAERAAYESLFVIIQAQMRAFQIPAAPLVKVTSEQHHTESSDEVQNGVAVAGSPNGSVRNGN